EYERHKAVQDAEQWAQEAQQTRMELLEMTRHSQAVAEELRRTHSYAKKTQAKNKQKVKEARELRAAQTLSPGSPQPDTKISTTNDKLKQLVRLQSHIERRASESKSSYEQRIAELERRLLHATYGHSTLALTNAPAFPACGSAVSYSAYADPALPHDLFRHTARDSARGHRRSKERKTREADRVKGSGTATEEAKENRGAAQLSQDLDSCVTQTKTRREGLAGSTSMVTRFLPSSWLTGRSDGRPFMLYRRCFGFVILLELLWFSDHAAEIMSQ
ncbi:hypothetical protein FOZ62_006829, partial [Perkinsus olseni]